MPTFAMRQRPLMGVMMPSRVCAQPGCPLIISSTARDGRCDQCRREREKARGSRQARGYDAAHDRLRAKYQARMNAGEAFHCWRCGGEVDPHSWHLGHDDLDRGVYRGPEHVRCNTATASRR